MIYKVDKIGSSTFYGDKLYPTIHEAREAQSRLGNDFGIYVLTQTYTLYGKVLRNWERVY